MDDNKNNLLDALKKAGLTDEKLLNKTEELIKAIETGMYKPKNKEKELRELKSHREELLERIKNKSS